MVRLAHSADLRSRLRHRPVRKMATGRAHGATVRSYSADSESSHLICILRAAVRFDFLGYDIPVRTKGCEARKDTRFWE